MRTTAKCSALQLIPCTRASPLVAIAGFACIGLLRRSVSRSKTDGRRSSVQGVGADRRACADQSAGSMATPSTTKHNPPQKRFPRFFDPDWVARLRFRSDPIRSVLFRSGRPKGAFSLTAVFSPRLRFCRATSDKWVLWRRAADKVAVEAAAGPEKMKSTARCSSGHSQASSWLFWWRLGDASAGDHARRGS